MSRIAKQDQRVAKAPTGVAPTSRRASAQGGSASVPRAYPPLSADPPPPGRARPRFCLPPCCDFSTPSMLAEGRENEIGAEKRAGGSQGAGTAGCGGRAKRGTVTDAILTFVRQGLPTSAIVAAFPQFKPTTIRVRASLLRKQLGLNNPGPQRYQGVPIPQHLYAAFKTEALARDVWNGSVNTIVLQLLETIVRDDLFNAILGDDA